jgi:ubiquinone biosynthesis accessory factor UbiJ
MIHAMHQGVAPVLAQQVLARVTLVLNHVIASEPEAMAKLRPYVGRSIRLVWLGRPAWLPAWLPLPPEAQWQVSAAGLLDLLPGDAGAAEEGGLRVALDGRALLDWGLAPAGAAAGTAPPLDVQGDAGFAGALSWLAQHLRWDIEDDLARVVGDRPARALAQAGQALVGGLRRLAAGLRRTPSAG